jgi:hypothetical protein
MSIHTTFQSARSATEIVIDDSNFQQHVDMLLKLNPDGLAGRVKRDYKAAPLGSTAMKSFPIPAIDRSEWTQRIANIEAGKQRISDAVTLAALPSKNQQQTNYCWCNAVVGCYEVMRCKNGLELIKFAPASVAAPVKNFRNNGGWGGEALDFMTQSGIAPVEDWGGDANAINRSLYTQAEKDRAAQFRVTESWELDANNFDQVMTCVLLGLPVAIGLSWWGHEVYAADPVVITPGKYGVRFRNSWGDSYGTNGFNILTESKATPDDACCIRALMPTNRVAA